MSKTILIVEDDAMQMKLVHDLLEKAGYETFQSADGLDTLTLAETHLPDLIIMDLKLPEASGLDYTRQLKADVHLKGIPVVAITGFPVYGGANSIEDAGCEGCLAKPISAPTLYEAVEKYIN